MRPGRAVVLIVAVLAALAIVSGTESVSSFSADREVQAHVAPDESASLRYVANASNVSDGSADLTVNLTNRLSVGLTNVSVAVDGETRRLASITEPLAVGETATASFTSVECGETVTVRASGGVVSLHLNRTVNCT